MRRAFTLIELIFTIVIMAGIFAVIPKILNMTNKSDSIALKQDALLQAVSLSNIASLLAWDENNTQNVDILQTVVNNTPCDISTTHRRVGSYKSANGRTCEQNVVASAIGQDSGESNYMEYDDIDDFNGTSPIEVNTSNGKKKYEIYTSVDYFTDDNTSVFIENGNILTINLNAALPSIASTNIKKFIAKVRYVGRRKDHNITSFKYFSANLGTFTLNSRAW